MNVGRIALLLGWIGLSGSVVVGFSQGLPVLSGTRDGTAVLVFQVGDEVTHAWVLASGGVRGSYRVEIPRSELRARVSEFLASVGSPPRPTEELVQYLVCLEQGRDLYDLLVSPGEPYLRGIQNVVIVPSDALWHLPFAALYRCPGCAERDLLRGVFWIEDQAISLAHSLEMALGILGSAGEPGFRSVLVVSPSPYAVLPGSRREAETVASSFGDFTVLLGSDATESRVKVLLAQRRYDVLHFTPGALRLNESNAFLSGIALSRTETDDSVLSVAELLALRVRVGLLVLSGSLLGDVEVGGGTLPLVLDAFRASGVASTVFALGTVHDKSAEWLMEALYAGLGNGLSRTEALRQAQLRTLKDAAGISRHPWYWALFSLYGEWREMVMPRLPGIDKLDYTLARLLTDWKSRAHAPDEVPPVVSVLVTLQRPATRADLEAFGGLSSELELVGSFGVFVQVRIPLPLLEALAALPQVRSISVPPETIHN